MVYRHGARRTGLAGLHRLGILLLAPLIALVSTAILLALLGIFVTGPLGFVVGAVVGLGIGLAKEQPLRA